MRAPEFYPDTGSARSDWIHARRGIRNLVDPEKPYLFFNERERMLDGSVAEVATVFLTNRECPWHCVMCDLWKNTTTETVPPGALSRQLEFALERLAPARVLKLYNSGSFFDPAAIPKSEWATIARFSNRFERVILECHPRLVNKSVLEFSGLINAQLEMALGLETIHPAALQKINKRITVDHYRQAVSLCNRAGIGVRSFLLVHPPFIAGDECSRWLKESISSAFTWGSQVISLIPVRSGNGAMDQLAETGEFKEPALADLEDGLDYGIELKTGIIFADSWDLERFSRCDCCFAARKERIIRMNFSQKIEPRINCGHCFEERSF